MYIYLKKNKKKKTKKNCDLLPLGSLFLLGLNSAPLSLYLSLLKPTLEGKKGGGGGNVGGLPVNR